MTHASPFDSPEKSGKRASGRPPFRPSEEQRALVRDLAAAGTPQEHICRMLRTLNGKPICVETLVKHFQHELQGGLIEANVAVAGALFKAAMSGNVTAMVFWLKTRAGWAEAQRVEVAGKPAVLAPRSLIVRFDAGT